MATTTAQQGSSPFIKQLASSNRTTRDRAVSALRTFLKRNAPLSATECLKLWKGLYYTMWMSDKPRNQQQLARDLADLMHVLPTRENFLVFVDGFWQTMSREWASIDALRMDKFLYLVRCYVQEGFQYVRRAGWDVTLVEEYMNVLETTPFELRSVRIPNGLRYHVVDLYVDELDKADEDSTSPVERLIAPMKKMAKDSPNKTARKRATEALDDERLGRWKTRKEIGEESEEEEEEEEDEDEEEGEGEDGEFGGFDD